VWGVDEINFVALAFGLSPADIYFRPTHNFHKGLKKRKLTAIFGLLVLTMCGCDSLGRQTSDRDNTAVNTRDRSDIAKTPMNQNQNQNDIDITANIRKQMMDV
jgi:hypothetical protein